MLRDKDVTVLNTLITTTIDSANGYEKSADDVRGGRFEQMFSEMAAERRQIVSDLQAAVREAGGTPNDDGSLKADLHRRWIDLRTAVTGGGGDRAVIEEVERGEDYLKGKYNAALGDATGLSDTARNAIRKAYESVSAGHDKASALKQDMATSA